MIDVCHLDEAGFSMTQPTNYTWYIRGQRLLVPYEAPQGRRVNVIGAYFSHGPMTGEFLYQSYANLPGLSGKNSSDKNSSDKNSSDKNSSDKNSSKRKAKTLEELASDHGLSVEEVGPIDSRRFLDFVWRVAGRPKIVTSDWKRNRPLMMVLDNYSVHHSQMVQQTIPLLEAADVFLVYLPSYSPELSDIEPIWNDIKQHDLPERSFDQVARCKRAVVEALSRKAARLKHARHPGAHKEPDSTNFLRRAA